jgi:hypothetical protein
MCQGEIAIQQQKKKKQKKKESPDALWIDLCFLRSLLGSNRSAADDLHFAAAIQHPEDVGGIDGAKADAP